MDQSSSGVVYLDKLKKMRKPNKRLFQEMNQQWVQELLVYIFQSKKKTKIYFSSLKFFFFTIVIKRNSLLEILMDKLWNGNFFLHFKINSNYFIYIIF